MLSRVLPVHSEHGAGGRLSHGERCLQRGSYGGENRGWRLHNCCVIIFPPQFFGDVDREGEGTVNITYLLTVSHLA